MLSPALLSTCPALSPALSCSVPCPALLSPLPYSPPALCVQAQLIQMVVWMLQHRLLIQLHTYVCLLVPPGEEEPGLREEELPPTARVGGRSLSTPSALSFGSPSKSPPPLVQLLHPGPRWSVRPQTLSSVPGSLSVAAARGATFVSDSPLLDRKSVV